MEAGKDYLVIPMQLMRVVRNLKLLQCLLLGRTTEYYWFEVEGFAGGDCLVGLVVVRATTRIKDSRPYEEWTQESLDLLYNVFVVSKSRSQEIHGALKMQCSRLNAAPFSGLTGNNVPSLDWNGGALLPMNCMGHTASHNRLSKNSS